MDWTGILKAQVGNFIFSLGSKVIILIHQEVLKKWKKEETIMEMIEPLFSQSDVNCPPLDTM